MAKILEALRQAEKTRSWPNATLKARPYQPEAEEATEAEAGEEVPFVEVGGSDRLGEGSPVVRHLFPSAAKSAASDSPLTQDEPAKLVTPREEELLRVAFSPLPAEHLPPRPAYERFAGELVAFHRPEHPISEQYRALRAGVAAQLPDGQSRVLLFTAATPQAGTTTVLLNLAITSAKRNCRVALIDANLLRPAVAERLGLRTAPGLREVLAGTASPQRALQETGQANLHALTAGEPGPVAGLSLGGEALRGVLRYLRGRFDLVLVDAPSWDGRPEVIALGSACDAVYLVAPRTTAESSETKELLCQIPEQGGRLRGCVWTEK